MAVTALALVLRLRHNLVEHPLERFRFVDMAGYVERADRLLAWTLHVFTRSPAPAPEPYDALWPYGTHTIIFLVKLAFRKWDNTAVAVAYAVLGAALVALTAMLGEALAGKGMARVAAGIAVAVYFPLISLGGYYLSEIPFAVLSTVSVLLSMRFAERATPGCAWLLGASFAMGATIRPQILLHAVLVVVWLVARGAPKRIGARHLARIAAPIAIVLALSAVRHQAVTGRPGLVSSNGAMNWLLGRCHANCITAKQSNFSLTFCPTPFGDLARYGERHPTSVFQLDPAMGGEVVVDGHLYEADKVDAVARTCIAKTGLWRQLRYALTHVAMLEWTGDVWPDAYTQEWGARIAWWDRLHAWGVLPAAMMGLLIGLVRRDDRWRYALLAIPLFGLVVTSMLYFGDPRFRAPYDGILIVLAMDAYTRGVRVLLKIFGVYARI